MVRLYEEMLAGDLRPPEALRRAQLWLRDLTDPELDSFLAAYPSLEASSGDGRRRAIAPEGAQPHAAPTKSATVRRGGLLGAVHRPRRLTGERSPRSPQMKTVLLDTNCLIDLAEEREPAATVRRIVAESRHHGYRPAVAAITASENPQKRSPRKGWPDFPDLLAPVGLADAEILKPMAYLDVTFWGELWVGEDMADPESRIHAVLFPSLGMDDHSDKRRWLNAKCDVQMAWTAMWNGVEVLITGDKKIVTRSTALASIRPIEVMTPVSFLRALEEGNPARAAS